MCIWPVIRKPGTGTILPAPFNDFPYFPAKHSCLTKQNNLSLTNRYIKKTVVTVHTKVDSLWPNGEKKSIAERNTKAFHFIILGKPRNTWESQQIHYTMPLALAALPIFPTSTSISQSVYCLPQAYSPYCPCPSEKLPVQITELGGVLKWTPAASLCPSPHFSNILTVTPQEPLRPISWF